MLVYYPFKLKYLNQKGFFFNLILKKHNFFLVNIEYIFKKIEIFILH